MELYTHVARGAARQVIAAYSTSFGAASRLFDTRCREAVADIYALVRLADEVVDTYSGPDAAALLDELEGQVNAAMHSGYSTNLLVHAFAVTAREYDISTELVAPFFASMRMDLEPSRRYDEARYAHYIYGSAEVVGLMCLNVFVNERTIRRKLEPGARALGAAFQKINFLRDLAADQRLLGRYYFPHGSFDDFDDARRDAIIADITTDLEAARRACRVLPPSSRYAVALALCYFELLARRLAATSAATIKQRRMRVRNGRKLGLFIIMRLRRLVGAAAV